MPPQLTNYSSRGDKFYAQFDNLITFEDITTIIKIISMPTHYHQHKGMFEM
jgi:hypothetical protein